MTKSTGVGTGNGYNYSKIMKTIPENFKLLKEKGNHRCVGLHRENSARVSSGESIIYIFKDVESKTWNMRVGLEFVRMKHCPYCGAEL